MRAIALALVLVSTPAVASEQFDLICTAKKTEMRYRIDIATGEYCGGDCKRVMKIAEVTSGMITLYEEKPTLPDRITAYSKINRQSGEWRWYNHSPRLGPSIMNITGACERVPFSGFPAPKF